MHSDNHDIDTLNGLIKTTIDSVDGYRAAADDADSSQYQSIFFKRADEREAVAEKLQKHVLQLGGSPTDSGSIVAGAHRAFMSLRDAISSADDTAIVAEVERGEDVIKELFEEAINDSELSPATAELVRECYGSVRQGHDQMRDLKKGLENSPSGMTN